MQVNLLMSKRNGKYRERERDCQIGEYFGKYFRLYERVGDVVGPLGYRDDEKPLGEGYPSEDGDDDALGSVRVGMRYGDGVSEGDGEKPCHEGKRPVLFEIAQEVFHHRLFGDTADSDREVRDGENIEDCGVVHKGKVNG